MKNKDVIIIAQNLEDIKRMETLFELAGYRPFFCDNINKACDMLEKFIPLAIIIVESKEPPHQVYAKEIKKIAPLVPVIIALKAKDHIKREENEKISDVVIESPWTEIELSKKLSYFENMKHIPTIKPTKNYKNILPIFSLLFILIIIPFIPTISNKHQQKTAENNIITIPTTNISGFFSLSNKTYIYDWLLQSFYIYDKNKLEKIKHFATSDIATGIKDGGDGFFFFVTDTSEIQKRNKANPNEVISHSKTVQRPTDLCFDGMYVWILQGTTLTKTLNDDKLSIISSYSLPYSDIQYIGCQGYDIYYYSRSKIYYASTENPVNITKTITSPDKKIISFDYKNNTIRYIYQENTNSFYDEIKLKPSY